VEDFLDLSKTSCHSAFRGRAMLWQIASRA
jgi:hypothetical protein